MTVTLPDDTMSMSKLRELVEAIERASLTEVIPMNQLTFFHDENSNREPSLSINRKAYSLTAHSRDQLVNFLKIPRGFYTGISLGVREALINALLTEGKDYWQIQFLKPSKIRGVLSSKVDLFDYTVPLDGLEQVVEDRGLLLECDTVYFDGLEIQLRVLLQDKIMIGNDSYRQGIHIQYSDIGYCDTIVAPVLYRQSSSTGLICLDLQSSLLKQKSLASAKKSIRSIFRDLLTNLEQELTLVKVLRHLKESEAPQDIRRKDGIRELSSILKGLPESFVLCMKAEIENGLDLAIGSKLDTSSQPIYHYINLLMNVSKQLPWKYRTRMEANITDYILQNCKPEGFN